MWLGCLALLSHYEYFHNLAASPDMTLKETRGLSGYVVRQPVEQKKEVVPRTPNPTDGMWLGCRDGSTLHGCRCHAGNWMMGMPADRRWHLSGTSRGLCPAYALTP
jgi:hypothetical protein